MELIRLDPACIRCILGKKLEDYPPELPREQQVTYLQRIMRAVANADKTQGAPVISREILHIQTEMFGGPRKDYTALKRYFNGVMLAREAELAEKLDAAEDPLRLSLQYATAGNYIDFGAMQTVDEEKLDRLLAEASGIPMPEETYRALRADVLAASQIVLLTDNCGEIVMDKLLLREIRRLNPQAALTVLVRGAPVINDATVEDARQVGLDTVAEVLGNGSDIAGTCLEDISAEALRRLDLADVILAKGQANFETLRCCGRNVYYIFMCKCKMFAERFGVPQYHGMLLRDSEA